MHKQDGFSPVYIVIIILIIFGLGFAAYRVSSETNKNTASQEQSVEVSSKKESGEENRPTDSCSKNPTIPLPVDAKRIASVLYPGQVRGNNFKPHGGFRLDGGNDAAITLPLDAKIIDGVRYIEAGEIQYMFDFETDCKIRFRLDHLHTLGPELQTAAEKLPQPTEETKTTNIDGISLKAGSVVATKIGFLKTQNASFDFGLYDMNAQNNASKDENWQKSFEYQTELAKHAVCWFDYLSEEQESLIRSLPAGDFAQGKNSVYCK